MFPFHKVVWGALRRTVFSKQWWKRNWWLLLFVLSIPLAMLTKRGSGSKVKKTLNKINEIKEEDKKKVKKIKKKSKEVDSDIKKEEINKIKIIKEKESKDLKDAENNIEIEKDSLVDDSENINSLLNDFIKD